jgi:hypothetical protein
VRLLLACAALLTAACAPVPRPDSAPLALISMDRNSWGRPVSRWTIDSTGKGSFTVPEPDVFKAERMVTRGFAAGPEGFALIRRILAAAETHAGSELECGQRITDQYYGTVRWGDASLSYDMGCQAAGTAKLLVDIGAAQRQISHWARNGPILETRKVESQ